jgi:hypothetical protein
MQSSAEDYVWALDLPAGEPAFESVGGVRLDGGPGAVAVGSQLVEFTERVDVAQRNAIADGILLAQLAANKAVAQGGDAFRWYDKYVEVLQNIGWQLREIEFRTATLDDSQAGVHRALIPVIMTLLGPQVAAASIVIEVLNGLGEIDRVAPWITVFDRSSRRSSGASFQVSHVDVDASGEPQVVLACFSIEASQDITQVLFFKFTAQNAQVRKASGRMAINLDRLLAAKDAIAGRVGPFVTDYVARLDL